MIEQEIRNLASIKPGTAPFLSLYIDTNRNDESQKDRIRLFLKKEVQSIRNAVGTKNGDGEAIEHGIRQIAEYIENSLQPDTRGVAIFACPQQDVFIPLQLPVPVEPQLRIDSRPHLRQLAELQKRYASVIVIMVDAKSARIFELAFGKILFEIDHEHPELPRRHDQGGWSQANLQRHVQDHIDRHHKEVADTLTKMFDAGRVRNVIVSGQERSIANFRTFLPKRIDEKICGTLHLDIRSATEEIVRGCEEILGSHRRQALATRLEALEPAAQRKGRGALGFDEVIDAANQRKLQHIFVGSNTAARGWRCTRCETLGSSVPLGCPACSSPIDAVDLVEELIASAHRDDADIDFVPSPSVIDRHQGVGALLRF